MEKHKLVDKWRCLSDWIKEQDYNLGLFAYCVDSAADEHFFRQHEVASCTGQSGVVPVQRWIEPHYNFGLFVDCVDSPAHKHFLRQHEVDYCTGRSDDVPVQRWIE